MKLPGHTPIRAAGALLISSALVAALTAAGCGGSSSTQSSSSSAPTVAATPPPSAAIPSTPAPTGTPPPHEASNKSEHAPGVSLEVSIPGLSGHEHLIPATYTCDGANTSIPVQWSSIPHGTSQLALFLLNLRPVNGKLFFDWALAGLSPTSHGIPAGTVPSGAIVARNSFGKVGYSICPPKGSREIFVLRLAALPHPVSATQGVEAATLYHEVEKSAKSIGISGGVYKRP
jgi:phosphatidylethanolamine-binding protein (PEBP) family uncharacterized protein